MTAAEGQWSSPHVTTPRVMQRRRSLSRTPPTRRSGSGQFGIRSPRSKRPKATTGRGTTGGYPSWEVYTKAGLLRQMGRGERPVHRYRQCRGRDDSRTSRRSRARSITSVSGTWDNPGFSLLSRLAALFPPHARTASSDRTLLLSVSMRGGSTASARHVPYLDLLSRSRQTLYEPSWSTILPSGGRA